MALNVPNKDEIQKVDPKLGEAVQKIRKYINQNTTQAAGNRTPTPTFVTPAKRPG